MASDVYSGGLLKGLIQKTDASEDVIQKTDSDG